MPGGRMNRRTAENLVAAQIEENFSAQNKTPQTRFESWDVC
jgi:hypothetical protein